MFKVLFNVKTKNGAVAAEQFFSENEKQLAIQTAKKFSVSSEYGNVRLLSYECFPPVFLNFESLAVEAPTQKPKPKQKVFEVASAVSEFDLPTVPKKRISKRERSFGASASRRSLDAVEN